MADTTEIVAQDYVAGDVVTFGAVEDLRAELSAVRGSLLVALGIADDNDTTINLVLRLAAAVDAAEEAAEQTIAELTPPQTTLDPATVPHGFQLAERDATIARLTEDLRVKAEAQQVLAENFVRLTDKLAGAEARILDLESRLANQAATIGRQREAIGLETKRGDDWHETAQKYITETVRLREELERVAYARDELRERDFSGAPCPMCGATDAWTCFNCGTERPVLRDQTNAGAEQETSP